jgi:hypothetical protein
VIKVSWAQLKDFLDSRNVTADFVEFDDKYIIHGLDNEFRLETTLYKDVSDTTDLDDFLDNYKPAANQKKVMDARTRDEREDIRDHISRSVAEFDVNGVAEISIEIPSGGRFIGGGSAFTDVFYPGDCCYAIKVVDVNNILGYGAEFMVSNYHDDEMPEGNQGWYFLPGPNNTGILEVENLGYYGFIPGGLFLELYFKKEASSTATKVFTNFWLGDLTNG